MLCERCGLDFEGADGCGTHACNGPVNRVAGLLSPTGTVMGIPRRDPFEPPKVELPRNAAILHATPTLLESLCAGTCGQKITHAPPKLRPADDEKVWCIPCAKAKGFGEPPSPSILYLRTGKHPGIRCVRLIAERFTLRFGRKPSAAAIKAFEDHHRNWNPAHGDLGEMADYIERWKAENPKLWAMAYPIPPKDDLQALRDLASNLGQTLDREQAEKQ